MPSPNTIAMNERLPNKEVFAFRCSHCGSTGWVPAAALQPPHDADVRMRKYPAAKPYRMKVTPSFGCTCGGQNRKARRAATK